MLTHAAPLLPAGLAALVLSGACCAEPMVVSVHTPANLVVGIDPDTGQVVDLGLIGTQVEGIINDIASDGERLYVMTSLYPAGGRIYEVDPSTGQVLSGAIITVDGKPAINGIEAIAVDEASGQLFVTLWRPESPSPPTSDHIGKLALTGEVTGVMPLGVGADADGLGRDPAGGLVGLDREPGDMSNTLVNVGYQPLVYNEIIEIPFDRTVDGLDDCAVFEGDIITIDRLKKRINRHDRQTGAIISSVVHPAAYTLNPVAVLNLNPSGCAGDLDGDGDADSADLNILLGGFGCAGAGCAGDIDGDGDTDSGDLNLLLADFGCS